MSSTSRKGPIVDPGLCRCCGGLKKCRLLNVEYEWQGQREVYSEMFVDCFGLLLSHLEGPESERVICATCVVRLRDARAFRHQVLQCEERLLNASVFIHDDNDEQLKMELDIKQEPDPGAEPLAHSDGEDHLTDPIEDNRPNMNITVTIKEEECPKEVANVDPPDDETERAKTEMLVKLKKMQEKLNKMQNVDGIPEQVPEIARPISPLQRRPLTIDKDLHILRNTIKIVENSYVCPFMTVFSDYHCVYCNEMFIDPNQLRDHTMTHDPKTYKTVVNTKKLAQLDIDRIDCRLCDEKIDSIDTFKEHITSVHKKTLYKDVHNEFMTFKLKHGTLTCVECGKNVGFFHALKKHMAEHFGTYICDVCGAHYFEERHLIIHKNTHNNNRNVQTYPCDECDKIFKSKNSRNFHVARIHKNEPAYPCNKCEEVFISYHKRYRHKMTVHGEKRCYPCEGCDKIFNSRKAVREHNQKTHLQLLRHECNICDKKFYLPSALRDHMTSHTGERNFRCEFCGKNYPRSKALKVHIQSHNTEKKFQCSLCPSSYTQITNYKNHLRNKHPFPEGEVYR
ncbi:zinc finger protein 12-like isoform X2 [Trichoplusia ni]|uniref:Zinc finger protein 12-like isoform X2 n=1 Tax=Trichoplusia ni TaxID=7111 RepID=A0A7E5WUV3_TRINI|nr:zinc finger protein 12-like isoform X2 [Trichoplusia ni]